MPVVNNQAFRANVAGHVAGAKRPLAIEKLPTERTPPGEVLAMEIGRGSQRLFSRFDLWFSQE